MRGKRHRGLIASRSYALMGALASWMVLGLSAPVIGEEADRDCNDFTYQEDAQEFY